jgi:hypothetical protein
MIPLVSQIYSATRSILGDDQVTGGEVFTDLILQPKYQFAYAELYRALQNAQSPFIQREAYFNVPANTGVLLPATAGIENLGQPTLVEERGGVTAWNVSVVTPGAGFATIVTTANTLATGNQPVIYGVVGITEDINDIWTVTVTNSTTFTANGCAAIGTYVSGGIVSISSEAFTEMTPQSRIDSIVSPGSAFQRYSWENGRFRFPPCSTIRQLRITYRLSGNAPTTTTASTGIDDCLTFLAYRTAGLAAPSKGMLVRGKQYTEMAVGPFWEQRGEAGGILGQMLDASVRNLQRLPPSQRRSPPFRSRRRAMAW